MNRNFMAIASMGAILGALAHSEEHTPHHIIIEKEPPPHPVKEAKPRRVKERKAAQKPLPDVRAKAKVKSEALQRLLKKRGRA